MARAKIHIRDMSFQAVRKISLSIGKIIVMAISRQSSGNLASLVFIDTAFDTFGTGHFQSENKGMTASISNADSNLPKEGKPAL